MFFLFFSFFFLPFFLHVLRRMCKTLVGYERGVCLIKVHTEGEYYLKLIFIIFNIYIYI